MAQQKADEQKVWSIMWTKMSQASQSKIQVETTTENMRRYTKREFESARDARELLRRMGYPTTDSVLGAGTTSGQLRTTSEWLRRYGALTLPR